MTENVVNPDTFNKSECNKTKNIIKMVAASYVITQLYGIQGSKESDNKVIVLHEDYDELKEALKRYELVKNKNLTPKYVLV